MTTTKVTLAKALNMGLRKAMEADDKVLLMGEDVGKLGGVFRITDGLQKDFGEDRVIDSPLAESGIVGTAVGLALRGYRPVVEIQFDGFVYPAFDHIVSQVAKLRARSLGYVSMPIVIRIPFGGGIGAVEHHSESPEAQFAHTPGLKVVACSNPVDGYWMIQQAIAADDPTRYRLSDDLERWKLKDPIARVEAYLRRNGLVDDEYFADLKNEADELGHHLREGCKALPDPQPMSVFDHVYSEMTEELGAQRDEFADYLDSFDSEGAHS